MFKKRTRMANPRTKEDYSTAPSGVALLGAGATTTKTTTDSGSVEQVEEEEEATTGTLQEILLLRKLAKQQQNAGIDLVRLNKGEEKKKKKKSGKRKEGEDGDGQAEEAEEEYGLKQSRAGANEDAGDDAENDDASKARRLVRSNNFTQQTNALDVDKHMMAYIEAELAKRRGGQSSRPGAEDGPDDSKTTAYDDPQEELYAIAEKYRIEKKKSAVNDDDEGNVTTSLGMLTSIPEVDLGMDIRLKNIEETERAKRAMMETRGHGRGQKRNEADESFAAARFYRPHHTVQSDAEALEDAKREVQGLPPINRGQQRARNETATDDQVYERFKKRVRKN